ncbi:cyclin-domain-containing protein [Paxillus ammoniavirescens]|nr:cyclin-domain-containing protein [Paxillus ammoniavirescens]
MARASTWHELIVVVKDRSAQDVGELLNLSTSSVQPSSSHYSKISSASSAVAYESSSARPNAVPQQQHQFHVPSSLSAGKVAPAPDNPSIHLPEPPLPYSASTPAPETVDIHSYAPAELLKLLASLLAQIAQTNDTLSSAETTSHTFSNPSHPGLSDEASYPPVWLSLTSASRSALANPSSALTFHARNIPTISLDAYLLRILKYCPTTNEVFISLLVYFDRMSRLASESTGRTFVIDSYNVHRLVIAGVTVASKFFSDVFYTNSRYAKVGGLPQAELNQLELQFLLLNDFRLVISPEEMQRYAEQLILFSRSQSQPSSSSSPSPNPATPSHPFPRAPPTLPRSPSSSTGPARAMGAIDAYGGTVAPDRTPSMRAMRTRDDDASSILSETSTEAETEGGDTTDDEPTIRPPNSGSSCCGDAEDTQGEGVFLAEGIRGDFSQEDREDKDRDRGDATPELRAQRRLREVNKDVGMTSPSAVGHSPSVHPTGTF